VLFRSEALQAKKHQQVKVEEAAADYPPLFVQPPGWTPK